MNCPLKVLTRSSPKPVLKRELCSCLPISFFFQRTLQRLGGPRMISLERQRLFEFTDGVEGIAPSQDLLSAEEVPVRSFDGHLP